VKRLGLFALLTFGLLAAPVRAAEPAPKFPLKEGDIWVMAGDSITAQHLHSNYFEAFCFARYPELNFAFRNSGVGGHTIPSTVARFDYDIAAWKPTVVSVELGMNDQGGTPTEAFIKNMGAMTERIRGIKARPVILSASPINNGETMAKLGNSNKRLSEYADQLKVFSAKEEIPYADQFHALIDIWGKNKPREKLANAYATVRPLAADKTLPGVEHLQEFIAVGDKLSPPPVTMQGDPVHPGAPGQLMMAAALLKRLGASGKVSTVAINATGEGDFDGCKVTNLKTEANRVSFDRLDECLPFPIPYDARSVLSMAPEVAALSQYTLKVAGLKDGQYRLSINGARCANVSTKQLAEGVNLTTLGFEEGLKAGNPIVLQMQAVLAAVGAKEAIVGGWRGLSQRAHAKGADPKLMDELALLTKKVEDADAKIRAAAKPKTLHFAIEPVK
jgi:lysophospholipase L1-like esterase